MMKLLALLTLISSAHAYVPTVESLFRHGGNPDVTTNGLTITLAVKKIEAGEKTSGTSSEGTLLKEERTEDFYKIFLTREGDHLKVAQSRYNNKNFSEGALEHKTYYTHFNASTMKPSIEQAEKGIFYGLLNSMAFNNGSLIVSYLKNLGVPVKHNNELINREKVEFMADYKRYLVTINKDRNARKTEINPMRPEDPAARTRADEIMNESMYVDTNQVKLSKDEGQIAWVVTAGEMEGVFSYKERDAQRLKYKSTAGDFEIICKDYWLANGTHALPRFMLIKTFGGLNYQVEILNLRHYNEKDEDFTKRIRNWEQILKGKESPDPRPEFLL